MADEWFPIKKGVNKNDMPRFLTSIEINKIISSFPSYNTSSEDNNKILKRSFVESIRPFLENIKLSPSKINDFIRNMIKNHYKSLIAPNTSVGVNAATSYSGLTQSVLSSFHSSGTAAASKVVSSVDEMKGLIRATSNQPNSHMIIYFKNPIISPDEIMDIESEFRQIHLRQIVNNFNLVTFDQIKKDYWSRISAPEILDLTSKEIGLKYKGIHILRLELNVSFLYENHIPIQEISNIIMELNSSMCEESEKKDLETRKNIFAVNSSTFNGIIDIYPNLESPDYVQHCQLTGELIGTNKKNISANYVIDTFYEKFMKEINKILIKGIEGVNNMVLPIRHFDVIKSFKMITPYLGQIESELKKKIINGWILYYDKVSMKMHGSDEKRIHKMFELAGIEILHINDDRMIIDIIPKDLKDLTYEIVQNLSEKFPDKITNKINKEFDEQKTDMNKLLFILKKEEINPGDYKDIKNLYEKIISYLDSIWEKQQKDELRRIEESSEILQIKIDDLFNVVKKFNIQKIKKFIKESLSKPGRVILKTKYHEKTAEILRKYFYQESDSFINYEDEFLIVKNLPERILQVIKKADKKISKNLEDLSKIHYVRMNGKNFLRVILHEAVDSSRSYCNNVHDMNSIFGIEATRNIYITVMSDLLKDSGTFVEYGHLSLVAEILTYKGKPIGATIGGINNPRAPISSGSVQKALEMIINGAAVGIKENSQLFSVSTLMGRFGKFGTGNVAVGEDLHRDIIVSIPGDKKIVTGSGNSRYLKNLTETQEECLTKRLGNREEIEYNEIREGEREEEEEEEKNYIDPDEKDLNDYLEETHHQASGQISAPGPSSVDPMIGLHTNQPGTAEKAKKMYKENVALNDRDKTIIGKIMKIPKFSLKNLGLIQLKDISSQYSPNKEAANMIGFDFSKIMHLPKKDSPSLENILINVQAVPKPVPVPEPEPPEPEPEPEPELTTKEDQLERLKKAFANLTSQGFVSFKESYQNLQDIMTKK